MQVQFISERIRNNLEDLKVMYVDEDGPISEWSDNLKMTFFLNCDVELKELCKYFKITPSETCDELGLSYGIMILQTSITQEYLEDRGVDEIRYLCLGDREILNHKINDAIYNYLIEGMES
jgi:hypothetical protein